MTPSLVLAAALLASSADTSTIYSLIGRDTVAIEQFVRSDTRLEGTVVSRVPRTAVSHYAAELGPDGRITRVRVEPQGPDRSPVVPLRYQETRTWGGLVGTIGVPETIDGGGVTAPNLAFYDLTGHWAIENEGIAPDIEVDYSAAEVIKGHDPQLERAVKEALRLLELSPQRRVPRRVPIDRASKPQPK